MLSRGLRRFNEKVLHLDRWALEVRCFQKDLAYVLDCKVGGLPTTYFGLPLGAPSNSLTF